MEADKKHRISNKYRTTCYNLVNSRVKKMVHFIWVFFFTALIIGCAEPIIRTSSAPSLGVDLAKYQKIAIVDFQVTAGSDRASFLMHDAIYKQLKKRGYNVMGRLETQRKIKDAGISTDFADITQNAYRIGEVLRADAIFGGTISSYPLSDEEIFLNQTVSISMVDTINKFVVWFGMGSCNNGTLKGCGGRIAKSALKDFPNARKQW